MNLILPAYETMWRVVLRSFLEIRYREAPDGDDWSRTMEVYLETLQDPDCMRQKPLFKSSHHNVKPMDIVKEGLRLYPPTRRVHRVFEQDRKTTTAFADIEKCHRARPLGGDDPTVFRPDRWHSIGAVERDERDMGDNGAQDRLKTVEENLGFMPFAATCPAGSGDTKGFSFKMIAILVAVLCHATFWGMNGKLHRHFNPPTECRLCIQIVKRMGACA